jgi:hypothetical protein
MSHYTFGARHTVRRLTGLDFGLRVRVETHSAQLTLFTGSEKLSARELSSELAEIVSRLRVWSFTLRRQLEQVASALLMNVECGFWSRARRAALDLADLLSETYRRGLADAEPCHRGERCALRIAELLGREVL